MSEPCWPSRPCCRRGSHFWQNSAPNPARVQHVMVRANGNAMEVEIQTSGVPVAPDTQSITGPDRIVVDFPGALPAADCAPSKSIAARSRRFAPDSSSATLRLRDCSRPHRAAVLSDFDHPNFDGPEYGRGKTGSGESGSATARSRSRGGESPARARRQTSERDSRRGTRMPRARKLQPPGFRPQLPVRRRSSRRH